MDNDPEDDPTSDYGDSMETSEFTSVNTKELYSYEAGRYDLAMLSFACWKLIAR